MDFDQPEPPPQNFFKRFRIAIIVTAVLIAGIVTVAKLASSAGSSKRDTFTLVNIAPPPPAPVNTPPPPPPQPEEQKIEEPMIKEEAPKEAPKDEPPLGTGIKGESGDNYGLGSGTGNGRIGGGDGSKWGWYASQVQSRIQQALQQNRKTRTASMNVNVRVWADPNGRISRAQLAGSTGDSSLDNTLRDEVLTGLQLPEPPPAGMPAPITLRVTARRPR
jgi:periplasmic protein TonB